MHKYSSELHERKYNQDITKMFLLFHEPLVSECVMCIGFNVPLDT